MKLLDVIEVQALKPRNFVAKHSQQKSGAGTHKSKKGKGSYRKSDRKNWKKDKVNEMQGDFLPYDETISMQIVKEIWRTANGDLKEAIRQADNFSSLLKFKLKAHAGKQSVKRI